MATKFEKARGDNIHSGPSERRIARNSHWALDALITGLAAPCEFLTGDLTLGSEQKTSTVNDSWENVGRAIRSAAERYRRDPSGHGADPKR